MGYTDKVSPIAVFQDWHNLLHWEADGYDPMQLHLRRGLETSHTLTIFTGPIMGIFGPIMGPVY